MKTLFFTDPHIGLNRLANTTPASRAKLKEALAEQVFNIMRTTDADKKVCVGDLFDTYSNDEAALADGYDILSGLDVCLAGNHDTTNRRDSISSLQFLSSLTRGVWLMPFELAGIRSEHTGDALLVGVPHVATQELFEESLTLAHDEVEEKVKGLTYVLLLHCNYESPFADAETTLNLTEAWATKLLERYDYVILGHEHQPRDLFGGRLIILGNTHPTGFADISDKRVAILEDGKISFKSVWSAAEGYLVADHSMLPTETTAQFVRVTGEADAAQVGAISRAIATLWKASPNLLAVKLDVAIKQAGVVVEGKKIEIESLPATIRRELEGTDMLELFNELMERAA